jgi:hypothetical protein
MRAIRVEAYGNPWDVVKAVDVPDLEPMIAWCLETTSARQCSPSRSNNVPVA